MQLAPGEMAGERGPGIRVVSAVEPDFAALGRSVSGPGPSRCIRAGQRAATMPLAIASGETGTLS
jgi:hypothetical protein